MPTASTLAIKIVADITSYEANLSKAERSFAKFTGNMANLGKALTVGVTAPLLALGTALAKSAADDAASLSKLERAFGSATDKMEAFIGQMMKVTPATDDQLREITASTQAFALSMGLAPAKAVAMTQSITRLAADLAAYNKVELSVAQDALEKGIAGKTKGLQSLNVVVSEAEIKAQAYRMGLASVGSELTSTQTATAALAAITAKMTVMNGEAARTIDDPANAWARYKQAQDSAADAMGTSLVPAFTKVLGAASQVMYGIAGLSDTTKGWIVAAGAAAAASGPLLSISGSLARGFTIAQGALLSFTGNAGLAGLATLVTPGGIVLAGLAALGLMLYLSGERAREAAGKLADYKSRLVEMTKVDLEAELAQLRSQLAGFDAAKRAAERSSRATSASATAGTGSLATGKMHQANQSDVDKVGFNDEKIQQLQSRIAAAETALARMTRLEARTGGAAGGGLAGAGEKSPFDAMIERADVLADAMTRLRAHMEPAQAVGLEMITTYDQLANAMGRLAGKTDSASLVAANKLQGSMDAMVKAGRLPAPSPAGGLNMTAINTMIGGPPATPGLWGNVGGPLPRIDLQPIAKVPEGLSNVEKAMQAGFMNVSVAIGETLASNLASRFGGSGSGAQVGGSLGSVFGSAAGSAMISQGAKTAAIGGSILAAAGNAIVPVVGGIVGTVIGGALGGLFGGHKKSVDTSARALDNLSRVADKVSESLSNIPQGFKIAYARYQAAQPYDPNAPPTGGTRPPGGDPGGGRDPNGGTNNLIVHGNVIIQQAADVATIVKEAKRSINRGGGGLALAMTGA